MVCRHCEAAVEKALSDLGLHVKSVALGHAEITEDPDPVILAGIDKAFESLGFSRITDSEDLIVEKAKIAILNHIRDEDSCKKTLSACLAEKLPVSYDTVSRLFSQKEGRTIERYYIAQKIERVKELLGYGEMTLSEIADAVGYSSVAHLSRQFKEVTGLTPTLYMKNTPGVGRQSLADV